MKTFYGHPLSELAEKMLHTSYQDRSELIQRKEKNREKMEMQSLRLYL